MKTKKLDAIVRKFEGRNIAVIGDLILDVYIWGKASRISQEAPVPVVQVKNKTFSLGGASNVMRNISSLGGKCFAFGVVGKDENGEKLLSLLRENGVITDSVIRSADRNTIEKQRIIAGNQQLLRIDYEKIEEVGGDVRGKIISGLEELAKKGSLDAIIIEDYAKGLLNPSFAEKIVRLAGIYGIPVGLDPHPSHSYDVKGFTFSTPNRSEAFAIAGVYHREPTRPVENDKALAEVASILAEKWNTKYLMITLGADGMALFEKGEGCIVIPTKAREVYDVTGAGDTVIAVFSLAILSGATAKEAAEIANHAAGIVVGRIGTSSVTPEELKESFRLD